MPQFNAAMLKVEKPKPARTPVRQAVNLERYVPAYLTWIANKLSSGASQQYLKVFDVGIETWRCMVLLKVEGSISAQQVSKVIGMDKASISRCFKSMQTKGLITMSLDAMDGRMRLATLTPLGHQLHDDIMGVALERERALLAVLNVQEQEVLIGLLRRLHENLPEVEQATQKYINCHFKDAEFSKPIPNNLTDTKHKR